VTARTLSTAAGTDHTAPPAALETARLKIALLAAGARVSNTAASRLNDGGKPIMRVRSGSCGGLDLILDDGTYVNVPVTERFAASSRFEVDADTTADLVITDTLERFEPSAARSVRAPEYYGRRATDGTPLHRVGQLCSDRLGIGLTNVCTYWRSESKRCGFCSIGLNVATENGSKRLAQMVEAAGAAYADPVAPARHLLLGGGTPDGPDAGAIAIAAAARAIKERWPQPIYAMLAPPADLGYLELLRESGVDEIGMNVEIFDADAAERFIPGKHAAIPLERYLTALERAVELFGPVNTRSITVVGLERAETTLAGVDMLASRGVLPILSPFRPLAGTRLENHARLSSDALWDLAVQATDVAAASDMPLGPTCIACQSNTLTLPGHPLYRFY
jgi:hypothetical protein